MPKALSFMVVAVLLATAPAAHAADYGSQMQPVPVQVAPMPPSGNNWTAGKMAAVGAGVVAGVMAANTFLPITWGMAAPMLGGVAGAMVGNWGYSKASGPSPMLRRPASMEAEAPSLFHLATMPVE